MGNSRHKHIDTQRQDGAEHPGTGAELGYAECDGRQEHIWTTREPIFEEAIGDLEHASRPQRTGRARIGVDGRGGQTPGSRPGSDGSHPKPHPGGGQQCRVTEGGGLRKLEDQAEFWMTPNVPNGGRVLSEADVTAKGATSDGKRQVGLEMQARYFPTPSARDHKSESGGKNVEPLPEPWPDVAGDVGAFQLSDFAPGPSNPDWRVIVSEYPELTPALCDFDRFILACGRAGLLPLGLQNRRGEAGSQEERAFLRRVGQALRQTLASPEAKSIFRGVVDGLAKRAGERTISLRLTGNGVVSLQAACGITELMRRAGLI